MPQFPAQPLPARPRIAITVGDVAGVGPELALRCLQHAEVRRWCDPKLYGPSRAIAKIASVCGLPFEGNVHDVGEVNVASLSPGRFSAQTGRASADAVLQAITDIRQGKIDALVTGPIQKEAWHAGGISYPGHTEMLADQFGTDDYCMLLTSDVISCALVTVHIPLADVQGALTTSRIEKVIELSGKAFSRRLRRAPRITVCGLNPHAGENGILSHGEEQRIIEPAIDRARDRGWLVTGPLPADTAFTPHHRDRTDVYVCMYHDQGLIPIKTLAFDKAVNVTLGLPAVRTSVDHGTALDIAWKGIAKPDSMLEAIRMAVQLCGSPGPATTPDHASDSSHDADAMHSRHTESSQEARGSTQASTKPVDKPVESSNLRKPH